MTALADQARQFAEHAVDGAFGVLERRIEWRRAHAHRLALEAQFMVEHLPRWRFLARARWRAQARVWQGRAWAEDQELARECGVGSP